MPTRRAQATYAIECHIAVLKATELPAAWGQTIKLADKPFADISKSDIEAIREGRRAAAAASLVERAKWETERAALAKGKEMDRPQPKAKSGAKGGEVGINRLLARLRHLFTWAIGEGIIDKTPFRRFDVTVLKLSAHAESPRYRRLAEGEEQALLQQARRAHLYLCIVATLDTGLRQGELLSLQWKDVGYGTDPAGEQVPRWFILPAAKTKTYQYRKVPISTRLRALLAMRTHAPDGEAHGPEAYVFGNDCGERIASIKTAWRATCRRAGISGLHFHDLRREFASRLLESGAPQHTVRDFLGHANISTTSRYLATTDVTMERAQRQLEEHQKNSHTVVTSTVSSAVVPEEQTAPKS